MRGVVLLRLVAAVLVVSCASEDSGESDAGAGAYAGRLIFWQDGQLTVHLRQAREVCETYPPSFGSSCGLL